VISCHEAETLPAFADFTDRIWAGEFGDSATKAKCDLSPHQTGCHGLESAESRGDWMTGSASNVDRFHFVSPPESAFRR
jgi:hypothetical protein